jgi:hypothetical protein
VGLRDPLALGTDENHLARDMDQWRALVNTEMSLRVFENVNDSAPWSVCLVATEA